ncbi:MAG: biotin/lipoyl-containing protein, partial [Thiobacillus sp.]
MKLEVRVPTLSDSIASGTLLPWRKQVGETVTRDETLVDLETDKVILEIPAPGSGTLVEIHQQEGTVVKAGEVVAVIETGESATSSKPAENPRTTPSPLRGEGGGEGEKAA